MAHRLTQADFTLSSISFKKPSSTKTYRDELHLSIEVYVEGMLKKSKIFFTDPGSAPTSSMKTRPKSSSERRQRPSSMSCEIIIPIKLQWGLDRGHNKHYFKLFLIFINSLSIITFSVFESNRQFSQQPFWLGNRKRLHVLIMKVLINASTEA